VVVSCDVEARVFQGEHSRVPATQVEDGSGELMWERRRSELASPLSERTMATHEYSLGDT
jgi:hypothetical protein